jgi:hypothetical protein
MDDKEPSGPIFESDANAIDLIQDKIKDWWADHFKQPEALEFFDQDQVDELRLNTQAISPTERNKFNRDIDWANSFLSNRYGEYIKESTPTQVLRERIIVVESQSISRVTAAIGPSKKNTGKNDSVSNPSIQAVTHPRAKFVLLEDHPDLGQEYFNSLTQDQKEVLIKSHGEDKLKSRLKVFGDLNRKDTIAHEIAHYYQPALTGWFSECGAYYYTREAVREVAYKSYDLYRMPLLADFYERLLSKYGDNIHRLQFGTLEDPAVKSALEIALAWELFYYKRMNPEFTRDLAASSM